MPDLRSRIKWLNDATGARLRSCCLLKQKRLLSRIDLPKPGEPPCRQPSPNPGFHPSLT